MRKALVLSFAVHAALFGVARPLALHPASAAPAPDPAAPVDRFAGVTAELPIRGPSGGVYDVSLDPPAASPPPTAPAPSPAPAPAPVLDAPAAPSAGPGPAPRPVAAAPSTMGAPLGAAPSSAPKPPSTAAPAPPRRRNPPRDDSGAERGTASSSPASRGGGSGGPFGAEGPASVRSFGRAFTHTIPLSCSTDPVWSQAALGDAGKLEIAVHVDATGHVTGVEPRGSSPPKALLSLVRRTMVLLEASTFAVRGGDVGEGTEILEIRATVSQVRVDAEAMGGPISLDNHEPGTAGFTQANGRHVEVKVRVLKVEGR